MSQLQEFFDYKNTLMEDILTSPAIVGLLNDEATIENADSLAYNQVYPYEYLPEVVQEGKTYICFDVDVQGTNFDKPFLRPVIYIWIFAHKSQLRLPEGGVRVDKICNEICKVINGSRKYGMGELALYAVKRFAPLSDYNGKVMTFYAKDFNFTYDPSKESPANRRFNQA